MSLLAAMINQTKPDLKGRVFKHRLKDDDDEIYKVSLIDASNAQRGIVIKNQIIWMLEKYGRVTDEIAKAMQMTSRGVLNHLRALENEGRISRCGVPGSKQHEWFIKR